MVRTSRAQSHGLLIKIDQLQQELKGLKAYHIDQMEAHRSQHQNEISNLNEELAQKEHQLDTLQQEMLELSDSVAKYQHEVEQLTVHSESQESNIANLKASIVGMKEAHASILKKYELIIVEMNLTQQDLKTKHAFEITTLQKENEELKNET